MGREGGRRGVGNEGKKCLISSHLELLSKKRLFQFNNLGDSLLYEYKTVKTN